MDSLDLTHSFRFHEQISLPSTFRSYEFIKLNIHFYSWR